MEKIDIKNFIDFWKKYYNEGKYPDKKFYDPYINNLSKEDSLDKLWLWKMGTYFFKINKEKVLEINKEKLKIY